MITELEAKAETKVWFHDNKAKVVNTEITSLPFKDVGGNIMVRLKGEKDPVKIDYLHMGHKTVEQINKALEIQKQDQLTIDNTNKEVPSALPAVIFEDEIGEKITAELIRKKAEPLMALTIANIFDEKGYAAVKDAKTKAVKMRTFIEKKEKDVVKGIKTRHASEIKEVTDYTAELYKACLEAQNDAEKKLKAIDDAKQEAADKLAKEQKEKTEGREKQMFELGMVFNGQVFSGYGRSFTKEQLHGYPDDFYVNFVIELEGMQMESGITGASNQTPIPEMFKSGMQYNGVDKPIYAVEPPKNNFTNCLHETKLANGQIIYLTTGPVAEHLGEIVNQQVANTKVFIQVI